MNDVFARWNLRPFERRLVVGVAVVLFLVINIVWVWPHFSDWNTTRKNLDDWRWKYDSYQKEIAHLPAYRTQVATLESDGASVPLEDQAIQFMRTVNSQAAHDGVDIRANSHSQSRTNQFFIEQIQNLTVAGRDDELVNFLYNLGSGSSLIRVRDLSLHPDGARLQLVANIQLVASYRKNSSSATSTAPVANPKSATNQTSTPIKK